MGKRLQKLEKKFPFSWYAKQSRNTKLAISLGAILVFVGILSILFTRSTEEPTIVESEPQEVVGIETANMMEIKVLLVEGTLESRTVESDWELAEEEQVIEAGTKLRTVGAISRAVLQLEDGSEVRIDANSQIEVTSATTSRVIISHEDGYVYNRILASDQRDYIVETDNAQFESIGTAFRTIATGDEEAVEVYQGEVREASSNQAVGEGEKLVIAEGGEEIESKVENLDIEALKDDDFINWNKERDLENDLFKDDLGFIRDFDGPSIEINDPKPSSTVRIEQGTTPTIRFKGKTEPNVQLTVESKSVSGSSKVDVKVEGSGSFKTPELEGTIGNSVFEFIAKDRRGNETKLNVNITFSRQTGTQEQGIVLVKDSETANGGSFSWGLVGITADDGVRLVYGETSQPSYPTSDYKEIANGNSFAFTWADEDFEPGKTYYFRVCRYLASTDTCDQYSNEESVTIIDPDVVEE